MELTTYFLSIQKPEKRYRTQELRLKFTPTFNHSSLSLRQLLCALRSPARRAQDPMLRLQSKFTPIPSFDLRLVLFFEEPFIRFAHSGWCPVLAARGVCVVLHTYATLGVPHHPPLTLTPFGLASQDFRLASGTYFTLAGSNFRGGGFFTTQWRSA
jgi:hypothetical protein